MDNKLKIATDEVVVNTEVPSKELLEKMEVQITGNLDDLKERVAANEAKLLTSRMHPDKIIELMDRQVDLGNAVSWLTQVKHERVVKPLQKYHAPKIIVS